MKAGAQRIGGDGFAHQVGGRLQLPEVRYPPDMKFMTLSSFGASA